MYYDIFQQTEKVVINLSIFDLFSDKGLNKKREGYCDEARTFIQVHFVRERGSDKYAFNTLSLKSDTERDRCNEWYAAHNNPDNFVDIVNIYITENKIKPNDICAEYGLNPKIFTNSSNIRPVEKWEAVAICFGLDLNLSEARALLKTAGYALTNSSETDLIIRYCLENDIYILEDINYILTSICNRTLEEIL
jgi:hypothetical protein